MTLSKASEVTPQRLQAKDLVLEDLQNELMVYDPSRNKAFCLNQTAAFVWKGADGKTSVAELAGKLSKAVKEPASERVVWYALDLLAKDGLLQTPDVPIAPRPVTRRDLLQKVGAGAIPVISVMFIHPAKAHASSMAPTMPSTTSSTEMPPVSPHRSGGGGGFWSWLENIF